MLVILPWSKGGWVNSEVFDHTSIIQFIERWFRSRNAELREQNITAWRRAVTGDLTSAFNFASPNDAAVSLPSTSVPDLYTQAITACRLQPGDNLRKYWRLEATFGWYDFAVGVDSDPGFQQRIAGHVETGKDRMTYPPLEGGGQRRGQLVKGSMSVVWSGAFPDWNPYGGQDHTCEPARNRGATGPWRCEPP